MKPFLLYFFLPTVVTCMLGQKPSPSEHPTIPPSVGATAPQKTADFSAEPLVVEHLAIVYTMNADGTGSRLATMSTKVQSDAAVKQLAVLVVAYAGDSSRVEIAYARVRKPDGTVVETPVSAAMDMPNPVTRAAPLYSDLKQMELPIRSLNVGDTLEWQVKTVLQKPQAPGQFWGQETFDDSSVVRSESLELRVPKDVYVNVWSPTRKPQENVDGTERVYRWNYSQLKPTVGKLADAEKELKKKQIWTAAQELDAKEGKLPSVAWTTFKSWAAVGDWYRQLESSKIVPDPTVKAKVVELTANQPTQIDKVRAVYTYVATQIHYIGVDFGVGRYQPHAALIVLDNQYGDCKDKHTLLAAMLNALGVPSDAVLIGVGVRFNEAVPSPASFNHVITHALVDGKPAWMDSTVEVVPYGALEYPVRDKQALVISAKGTPTVERTPAKLPFAAYQNWDATGVLDKNGVSNSRIKLTLRGDAGIGIRMVLRQISPALYDKFVQQFANGMGYAGTTSNVLIENINDMDAPLQIAFDYKRDQGGDWQDRKILPQLPPVGFPTVNKDDPPVRSIRLGVPLTLNSSSSMKLPSGWGVELPDSVHAKSIYATYDETYKFENRTVYVTRRVEVLKDTVPVADWKTYKTWLDGTGQDRADYVQLTNTGSNPAAGATPTIQAPSENSEAARLVASAIAEMQRRNFSAAQTMLDRAKLLNPEQDDLWTVYGYVAERQGRLDEAVEDCKNELSLHPRSWRANTLLVFTYVHLKQPQNASDALKKWVSADPANPLPAIRYVSFLLAQDKYKEAVAAGEAALANVPDSAKQKQNLQLVLGRAQLKAGLKEQGRASLVSVLQTTQDPELLNDAAYELADADLELPLAEQKTRAAIDTMDADNKTWTAKDSQLVNLGKTRLLVATWDTLGWTLYREGKLNDAKNYSQPAWNNGPSGTVGDHLGQVEQALGDKNAAMKIFELALASMPQHTASGAVMPASQDLRTKLQTEISALRQKGAVASTGNPQMSLQQLRTFSLGSSNGISESAEYWLLLANGTISDASPVGSTDTHGGQARMKTLKLTNYWPTGSSSHLVRKGVLFCGPTKCQLVLEP